MPRGIFFFTFVSALKREKFRMYRSGKVRMILSLRMIWQSPRVCSVTLAAIGFTGTFNILSRESRLSRSLSQNFKPGPPLTTAGMTGIEGRALGPFQDVPTHSVNRI